MLKIIPVDGAEEPYRAPDLIWDGIVGDLAVNALTHPEAPGDFRAEQGLATQIFIHLMSDARVEESELDDGEENRGWFGDSFDVMDGEQPIGSRLWRLRRRALHDGIEIEAEDYAREALQPLLSQSAVASIDVSATADRVNNRLDLVVTIYGRNGEIIFNQKYELLWRQIDGVDNPLAG
ncbi:phage GP46 family protein [Agrobacterium sp. AGB01]|uniref:phage GP46 family protein n=1 Tax=Agrobacterium sp. AGB01 TaxID=2769302 RepID=UPI001FEFD4C4|nr:phage GP46 family protein [Agrobacterium sp. AGB01]